MLRLIKWLLIIALLSFSCYLFVFFKNINEGDINKIKKDAISAIESNSPALLIEPLGDKIKEDMLRRNASFFQWLWQKIKHMTSSL